jgi:hypothetical protein
MNVEFDEATHTYRIDGRVVPSVTQSLQLLDPFASIDRSVLEAARAFGVAGHRAMALLLRDRLDWSSLDRALLPYIEAGADWLRRNPEQLVLASEKILADKALGTAGMADLITEDETWTSIVEFKFTSGLSLTVGPQTAAYQRMYLKSIASAEYLEDHRMPRLRRVCVTLAPGKYTVDVLNDPSDWPNFVSCLNITKWKWKHGIK